MAEVTEWPNFYSFSEQVCWDYLLENGFNPESFDHEESIKNWVTRIRGVIGAHYIDMAWPAHFWARWEFFVGRYINGTHRFAVIRQGTTEDLFRDLESDQLWSALMTDAEHELWLMLTPESRATSYLTRKRP